MVIIVCQNKLISIFKLLGIEQRKFIGFVFSSYKGNNILLFKSKVIVCQEQEESKWGS